MAVQQKLCASSSAVASHSRLSFVQKQQNLGQTHPVSYNNKYALW